MTTATLRDSRRITESDPTFQSLRKRAVRSLTASLHRYVQDIRKSTPDAPTAFIARQVGILEAAYRSAYQEGFRHYWQMVSNKPAPKVEPPSTGMAQTLRFYAPSIAKQAAELHQTAQRIQLDELDDAESAMGVRIGLQANLTWASMQGGYYDGNLYDDANPFGNLWWNLEPLARHCDQCPAMAAASPYGPPGSGRNELNQTPGDGKTDCGAACKCDLSYGPGDEGNNVGAWVPRGMPGVPSDFTPPVPAGATLTVDQRAALDAIRAAQKAWGKVAPDLPKLPSPFDPEATAALPPWANLTPEQQGVLDRYVNAVVSWSVATNLTQLSESNGFLRFHPDTIRLYSPDQARDGHGRFAPEGKAHITHTREALETAHNIFGRAVSPEELARMTGAQAGDHVSISEHNIAAVTLTMHSQTPGRGMEMTIEWHSNGAVVAHVNVAYAGEDRSAASGRQIIEAMHAMRQSGIDRIETVAAGSGVGGAHVPGQITGYRVWAELGFKGMIEDPHTLAAIRDKFGPGIHRVEQMQTNHARRTWWRNHGTGFHATFDFHDPESLAVLDKFYQGIHRHDHTGETTQGGQP